MYPFSAARRLTLAFAIALVPSTAYADGFVVLRNKANAVASIDADGLRRLFSGRTKQWDSGAVVQTALITSESAPETAFLAGLLGMKAGEFLNRVQQDVFRGELKRPLGIKSSADCVAAVKSNPGAICVASDSVAGSLPAEVVVLPLKK
jgi:ABC-type phosphate transport system substrate-binding protein